MGSETTSYKRKCGKKIGKRTYPYAQGCDLSWTYSNVFVHGRAQPWANRGDEGAVPSTVCSSLWHARVASSRSVDKSWLRACSSAVVNFDGSSIPETPELSVDVMGDAADLVCS